MKKSFLNNAEKLLYLLSPTERRKSILLLFMLLLMALIDAFGVASILPFIAVISNPDVIETNAILNKIYIASNTIGVESANQFLVVLGLLVFLIIVFSLIFKAFTNYALSRFVLMREFTIGVRLVKEYLYQPYSWFLGRNSADLSKIILSEVNQVIGGGLKPLLDLIAQTLITVTLVILLIIIDPELAIIIGLSIGGVYGLIFYFINKFLKKIGNKRLENNKIRFMSISEAFSASKEIKLGGLEKAYIKKFSQAAGITAKTGVYLSIANLLPRFFLEAIAFGGILLIAIYLISQSNDLNNFIPIISLYVFAGYRLMPAVQSIYASFAKLSFIGPSVDKLYEDLKSLKPFAQVESKDIKPMPFKKEISLDNVNFNYPNTSRTALKNININIPVNSTVGLVGPTGSGKTTIIDIILGLLEAQKGNLKVDGEIVTKQNSISWQKSIGYVPQNIYLADDTIAANIAFGVDSKDINLESVEKASKIANLHNFVMDELPQKYQTKVGERGVRLSGGQRQRIGIARALYYNPKVLVLDEATSALDNKTERVVMDAVNSLNKHITIIIVAHRLKTIMNCDKIFLLEKGELKNEGSLEELIKVGESFDIKTTDEIT